MNLDGERKFSPDLASRPIPVELPSVVGWKEILLRENDEPLVALGPFSENDVIYTHSIYFGEKKDSPYPSGSLEGSLVTMFVRQEIAQQLRTRFKSLLSSLRRQGSN